MVVEDDRRKLYELQVEKLRNTVTSFTLRNLTHNINDLDRCFEYDQLRQREGSGSSIIKNISEKSVAYALKNTLSDYFASISKHCDDCKRVSGNEVAAELEKKCRQSSRFSKPHSENCKLPNITEMTCDDDLKKIIMEII